MNQPLISIITPTYNTTPLIYNTYCSLLDQVRGVFEWIIIDDGSEKNAHELIHEIIDDNKLSVRFIKNEQNKGAAYCRNLGAKNAYGSYLMFLDDDDAVSENYIKNFLEKLSSIEKEGYEEQNNIIYCNTKIFEQNKDAVEYFDGFITTKFHGDFKGQDVLGSFIKSSFFNHTGLLLPKSIFLSVGGYDEELVTDEDGDLIFKLLIENNNFFFLQDTFYYYRRHQHRPRLSENESIEKIESRLDAVEKLIIRLKEAALYEKDSYYIALNVDAIALETYSLDKNLAQRLFARAKEIYPGYLTRKLDFKKILRLLIGNKNFLAIKNVYGLVNFKRKFFDRL